MSVLVHLHRRHCQTRLSLYAPFSRLFSSDQSCLSIASNALIPPCTPPHPISTDNFSQTDFSIISDLLRNPTISSGPSLESALNRTGIEPRTGLLQSVFEHFEYSPKLLHAFFLWAESKPGFRCSAALFNSMINVLTRAKEFDSAWTMVLEKFGGREAPDFVSKDTFVILIRRYARAGMPQASIRTFEFASNLDLNNDSGCETSLLEILLDSLCKEGHVKEASEYFNKRRELDQSRAPSIRVYNILLNGWFRTRNLRDAERFWFEMRKEDVKLDLVTYGTLVKGYCRMRHVKRAIQLVKEMRSEGIEPNAVVYNPIIDGLAEAGKFDEVLGMMERFLVCEPGPTMITYTSLVKGYCKAGDLEGASKALKMMISRGLIPTSTTYNYFFRYYSKFRKVDEAMNLYTKMIESGYSPDSFTYHVLLKMLCKEERMDLAIQVSKEMKARGFDLDLATSTMLIHLFCRMYKFDEAFAEFEDMIRRGIVPQYLTFQRLDDELKKRGMTDMSQKLCNLMSSVPHSVKLSDSCSEVQNALHARRRTIIQKAEKMSHILMSCRDPRKLVKHRSSIETAVSSANQLMKDIHKRAKDPSTCDAGKKPQIV